MKLWIDDSTEAPAGWRAVRTCAELELRLRSGRISDMSIGGSDGLAEACAQTLEQGAFTGRIRPVRIEVRLSTGPIRDSVERCLANAGKHWAAMPPMPPARRPGGHVLLRFAVWHLLGFGIAVAGFEAWHLWRHGTHAPIVAWFIPAQR